MKCFLYTFVILFFSILIGCSDSSLTNIQKPVISKKLQAERITSFIMDKNEYMWIGTLEGLNVFDGYQYNSYFYQEDDSLSLVSNQIKTLFKDSRSRIWVGTENGVCYYNSNGNFVPVVIEGDNHQVDQILENKKGEILLNIQGSIYIHDSIGNSFVEKKTKKSLNQLIYVYPDSNGGIWKIAPDVITHYSANFELISQYENMPKSNLICVAADKDSVWISTRLGGVRQLNLKNGTITELVDNLPILPRTSVYYKGRLIYSSKDGIYAFDLITKKIAPILSDDISIQLNPQEITSWYVDSNENLWIGSANDGYRFINFLIPEFNRFKQSNLFEETNNQSVISLNHDKNNNVWAILSDGKIIRYNTTDSTIWNYRTEDLSETSFFQHKALDLLTFDNGIWILTKTRVYLCHLENDELICNQIRKFGNKKILLENKAVDQWGNMVIGTNQKSILVLNNDNSQLEEFPIHLNSFGSNTMFTFLQTGELLLFMEGMHLALADIKKFTFKEISLDFREKGLRITPSSIHCFKEKVWLGTNNGLYVLDIPKNEVTHIESIPKTTITSIIHDKEGHLWLGTHRGIVKYLPEDDEYIYYSTNTESNSYLSYNKGSVCLYNDSIFVFGHNKGVTMFSLSMMKQKNDTELYIERIVVQKNATETKGIDLLNNPTDHVFLKYNENDIAIAFASIDYNSSPLAYYYKMEGFDSDWIWSEERRQANYPNLPPGDYQFRVKVGYLSDSNSNIERNITISVAKAPWVSTGAIFLYVILASLFLIYINRLYLRIKSEKLSVLMAEKEKEQEHHINEMNRSFFANISHEFRNPLTMILGPISILRKDKQMTKETHRLLDIASQSVNQMLKLIDQMLDFNRLDDDVLRLQVERYDIIQKMDSWVKLFEISAGQKNIQVRYTGFKNSYFALLDIDKLDKILGNLFSNALKHTPQDGIISIETLVINQKQAEDIFCQPLPISETYLYVSVSDSGSGIPEEMLEDIFKRYYQVKLYSENWSTGIGLYYVKQLIDLHKGAVKVRNSISEGAIFYFILPLDESAYLESERLTERETQHYLDFEELPFELSHCDENRQNETGNKPRILIVDDNINMSYYLKTIFFEEYSVYNKYDAESALISLDEIAPDLILLDVVMNGISGYELCKMLKEDDTYCHIPIILITAKSDINEKVEGLTSGANAYVTKPFNPLYLQALMQTQMKNLQNIRKQLNSVTKIKSGNGKDNLSPQDKVLMDEIYNLMEQMIRESELNMTFICQHLKISRSKIFYKLKGLTGETPNNFFKRYKLNKAAELLREGRYNVSEVSYMTGFSTISHFSVSFKKQFGINPSEYK